MPQHRIRPAIATDLHRIKEIAVGAEMFSVNEAQFFDEMVHGALDGSLDGHHWLVAETADQHVVAAAQFAPEPFADRMWNLYFIAVDPEHQGRGLGRSMMSHVESDLQKRGADAAQTIVVETSSTDQYARTRDFYAGLGYDLEARIRDFYGPGDHKIVFWKKLNP